MYLIVGLGNPTKHYANNRHNVGFLAIDSLLNSKEHIDITKTSFFGQLNKFNNMLFLKPTTFMNNSGKSLQAVASFYKIDSQNIFIIYDDLDMKFGALKFRIGGRDAGHNGLKSINNYIENNYTKIKVGIGRPEHKGQVNSYVLSDFEDSQKEELQNKIFPNIEKAILNIDKKSFKDISSLYSL
ncbi:Peptidyl-tRNA hydrolase [hydrothermal vent metagenome]|uniref:peptidyl-tRNA hydrolase n=1 Tax=hydrothermal vent metagenome TaxID=652676 RepID=A0A3B1E5D3_9ZZZZ